MTQKSSEADRVPSTSEVRTGTLQTKTLSWSEQSVGDCHQINGSLLFISDGRGKWTCETWTDHTHSGDVWHCSIAVEDQYGLTLFPLGEFNSPRMNQGVHYQWERDFIYPAEHFDAIAKGYESYSC